MRTPHEIIQKYYEYASEGNWDAWCDLFHDDYVMDEQLAGRVVGMENLRNIMRGFPQAYKVFQNSPKHILVDGDRGAVVSHISARAMKYPDEPIEAEAMNYFEFREGRITYMANFHDSKPFAPFLRQLSEG
ncbi:MAG: nuclear transport factor 2 family protein [Chloroflexi bacterium]|nr:nuclear transport factor 2 family protein [Chloroflexota bacterium]